MNLKTKNNMANQIKLNEEQLRNMIMQAINEEMEEGYFGNLLKRGANKVANAGKQFYNNYQADKAAFNAQTADEKNAMQQAKAGMQQAKTGVRDAKRINRDIQGNLQKDYQNLTDMQNRYKQIDNTITYEIGQIKRRIGQLSKQAQTNYTTAQDTSAKAKEAYGSSKSAYRTAKQNATNTYGMPQPQQQAVNEAIDIAVDRILNEIKKH